MREDLLGYLLDALDDEERQRVVQALQSDPDLRRELEQLRQQLGPLDAEQSDSRPPQGLADHTCDLIDAFEQAPEAVRAHVVRQPAPRRSCGWTANTRESAEGGRQWSSADSIVAAGIFLAVSLMFFPAIAGSRFRSGIVACQHNLLQLGDALEHYSNVNGGYFPVIPVSGNRSAAGIYGPMLYHNQFFMNEQTLICPASNLCDQRDQFEIPALTALDQARGARLFALQRTMGGSYGYTLGYKVNGRYHTPRNLGRGTFALMSDRPSLHLAASQSDNHGGRGQNVLFDDFRVVFLPTCTDREGRDNLFRSRRGFFEAGTDDNDSVIGHSHLRPMIDY